MDDKRDRFEAEVLPHLDAAYRFALWLARSPADADDITQEALLRAFRGFNGLRGEAKAWLLTIVRNCHATAHRQRERRAFVPLPQAHTADGEALIENTAGPEGASMHRDHERAVQRWLAELPEEQREVLVLRELEDMDYRDIAAVTNVPIGTVMSRLNRARAALKARRLKAGEGAPHDLL